MINMVSWLSWLQLSLTMMNTAKDGIGADSTRSQKVKEQTVKVCSSVLSLWLLQDPPTADKFPQSETGEALT